MLIKLDRLRLSVKHMDEKVRELGESVFPSTDVFAAYYSSTYTETKGVFCP